MMYDDDDGNSSNDGNDGDNGNNNDDTVALLSTFVLVTILLVVDEVSILLFCLNNVFLLALGFGQVQINVMWCSCRFYVFIIECQVVTVDKS